MMNFLQSQILFYATLGLVLFLPGFFLVKAIFRRGLLTGLETLTISFGASIIAIDFLMLTLGALRIPINRGSLLASIAIFSSSMFVISLIRRRSKKKSLPEKSTDFSRWQMISICLVLLLAVFLRTGYLKYNALPATTDLGHHMYWSQTIIESGEIPDYAARDIVQDGESFSLGEKRPISDFIVGEHLIFAAVSLISGINIISYLPVVVLHLINLFSLIMIFVLALRFFEDRPQGKNIAILGLFLVATLFAVAPPQAKYVGGGVIGNLIGNLLLPGVLFFFLRSLREKNPFFLAASLFFTMGLFYTHHLTGLMLILVLLPAIAALVLLNFRQGKDFWKKHLKTFFSPPVFVMLAFSALFLLAVYAPTYLTNRAVGTVVGEPAKIEHTGLTSSVFKAVVGEPRSALGIIGSLFLLHALFTRRRSEKFTEVLLLSWAGMLALISLAPSVVGLSIPSGRVANYTTYPLALISAYAVFRFWEFLRDEAGGIFVRPKQLFVIFSFVAVFAFSFGYFDNAQYAARSVDAQKSVQTFSAAKYLAQYAAPDDLVATDHIYVASDSWVKLFFMRDYNFPVYRANLERYSNNIDKKEFCTLWMINDPQGTDAQKCFSDLGVDFVLVDAKFDEARFSGADDFWKIYSDGELAAFYRHAE